MEILKHKPINKGSISALISIKIPKWGDFVIKEIVIFEKNGGRWISFPQRTYEKNGEKKYYSLNSFSSGEVFDKFQKQVLQALDEYLKKNPDQSSNETDFAF